ncbi:MAG: hypothetical protein COX19_00370 [Desulfobacterales bacterium CG23_combo_of_CG06-09_8_20_14_all_51_8]|nr:MAG: hypothetical protein COX19_00370 [Desulfobacterales bacterium CG23_combo_of_CG06-09_8_20_14_all_51_8]
MKLSKTAARKVFFFGFSPAADVRAVDVIPKGDHMTFTLELPDRSIPVELKSPGEFMVKNALAAASVGYLNGLSADAIKDGLEGFLPVKGRMDIWKTRQGVFIIDGSYNANPGSMEAAIRTLAQLKGPGRGILVAGDMLELGKDAEQLHEAMGRLAARLGLEKIFHTGNFAPAVKKGACEAGMADHRIFTGDKSEVTAALLEFIRPGDWVLVKGSRGAKTEDIVHRLEALDGPAA